MSFIMCQTPSNRRTDGRTDCPSVRLLDGVWHYRRTI